MPVSFRSAPEIAIDSDASYSALISTSIGDFSASLVADSALTAVNNFVFLAREGFYDNTTIHRLVPGFVAQGGSPDGSWNAHPGYLIEGELPAVDQPAYPPGTLALAEYRMADDPPGRHRQGCQFFITLSNLEGMLDHYSPVIGHLDKPTGLIEQLNAWRVDEEEAPIDEIAIQRVTISEE